MSGRDQADLYAGSSQICDSGARRIQAPEGAGGHRAGARNPEGNIFILRSGNVLELNEEKAGVTGQVAAGAILVDGLGIGDVGNVVLRDRQHLAEDGIMIVVVALDSISGQIASGPDLRIQRLRLRQRI